MVWARQEVSVGTVHGPLARAFARESRDDEGVDAMVRYPGVREKNERMQRVAVSVAHTKNVRHAMRIADSGFRVVSGSGTVVIDEGDVGLVGGVDSGTGLYTVACLDVMSFVVG